MEEGPSFLKYERIRLKKLEGKEEADSFCNKDDGSSSYITRFRSKCL
jgi:hypothetical protein